MKAIVNVSEGWAIGKNGRLLVLIPEDMRFFRRATKGKVCVMGRATLDSFPGSAPLRDRVNIVITRDERHIRPQSFEALKEDNNAGRATRLYCVHSIEEAAKAVQDYPPEDVFVIGGAQVYRDMLPYCDTCLVTKNSFRPEDADTFFPDLDSMPDWELAEEGEEKEYEGIRYRFLTYRRKGS